MEYDTATVNFGEIKELFIETTSGYFVYIRNGKGSLEIIKEFFNKGLMDGPINKVTSKLKVDDITQIMISGKKLRKDVVDRRFKKMYGEK